MIFLFMAGAPSHLELFDNKPELAKFDGTLPPPELLQGLSRGVHQSEFDAAGSEVQVRPAWAMRRRIVGAAAAPGHRGRRHCHRPVDVDRRFQSRAGPDLDEHRQPAVRPAEHRGLGHLWPGKRSPRPAGVRRLFQRLERAPAAATPTGAAASCRRCIRECNSARAASRSCICRIRPASTTRCSAIRSRRSRHSNDHRLAEVGDPEIATRTPGLRDGRADAIGRAGIDGPVAGNGRNAGACTAPSRANRRSPTIACWPAGWSSAASATCSCSTKPGTSTATWWPI